MLSRAPLRSVCVGCKDDSEDVDWTDDDDDDDDDDDEFVMGVSVGVNGCASSKLVISRR